MVFLVVGVQMMDDCGPKKRKLDSFGTESFDIFFGVELATLWLCQNSY
jgi:hypothetical protein